MSGGLPRPRRRRPGARTRPGAARLALRGALLVFLAVPLGCAGDDAETVVEEADERDRPELVLGRPFEGTALVDDVLTPRAFRLLDTLVVSAEPVEVVEGERAVVTGRVRRWDVAAVENELGVDLDASLHDVDEDLVVLAEHVEAAPEGDELGSARPGLVAGVAPRAHPR